MNNDSALGMTGVTGESMFENNLPDEDSQEAERKQQQQLIDLLPTAKQELESIDLELASNNTLTEFFSSIGEQFTDVKEIDIRAKLEARYGYVNYLLKRRSLILSALVQSGEDIGQYKWLPPAFVVPTKVIQVPLPHLYGVRAIAQGLRDLFRGPPMS